MFQYLANLPEVISYGIIVLLGMIMGYFGWKSAGFIARIKLEKEKKKLEKEHHTMRKGLKYIWDEEKEIFKETKKKLSDEVELYKDKLEDYRRKLAGMGSLNFFSKKRSDILYSLLLENETLEQLLGQQTKKINDQNETHLQEKLIDIRKRQRLMSEIFNDEKIKGYVGEIIEEKKLTLAGKVDTEKKNNIKDNNKNIIKRITKIL